VCELYIICELYVPVYLYCVNACVKSVVAKMSSGIGITVETRTYIHVHVHVSVEVSKKTRRASRLAPRVREIRN